MSQRIEAIQTDITTLKVDAIVNAANSTLLGGGGVDGAIHRKAGPKLLEACRVIAEVSPGVRCPTGEARITPGFHLPAKYVIHTVGPVYSNGRRNEAQLLANCYRNSLDLAVKNNIRSIAFPAISTGAYRYPPGDATKIAVIEAMKFLEAHPEMKQIIFACFSPEILAVYDQCLKEGKHK